MSAFSNSNSQSGSDRRPLNLRMRTDLTAQRQSYQGRDYWVIKDPISLRYFRFEEEEYALLNLLDGKHSPDQIKRQFDFDFAPQKITMQELYQFIGMLYRSCLLVSDAAGQGIELKQRGEKRSVQKLKGTLSNVLAIRFKGFDPEPVLSFLDRRFWWFFTWQTFALVVLLWIAAGALLFTHFELFVQKLPAFHDFFAAKNWVWLALVMAVTKIIHEFGHGLACKRFGGQCHEMGVMLLVLTPCLYCNVSDSWTLPSKWKRALIAVAGMYVELVLAAIAVFLWWFSQPGLVNQLALNVIFVSSVSTILFNANPLLRYDGYYILSDLLEIPNLRQKASTILQRQIANWTLGIESRPDPFLPTQRKWFFAFYSVAAAAYRWFITFSIFWFLYTLLEPYGVKIIGQAIALFAIWGLIGMPLIQAYRFFSVPGRFGTVKQGRAAFSFGILAAVVAGIMMIPLPHHVRCPLVIQSQNAENIYVEIPGKLKNVYVNHWQRVEKNQPILQLASNELELQIVKLEGKISERKSEFDTLQRASQSIHTDEDLSSQVVVAHAALESARADLAQRKKDVQFLQVKATTSGFLVPPDFSEKTESENGELSGWNGYPSESRNLGCYLQPSTIVGKIVPDQSELEAVLVVDQSDIEFIETGQAVELFIDSMPWSTILAQIGNVSTTKMKSVPKSLASRFGGDLTTSQNRDGVDVPQSATFQVSVPFEDADELVLIGCTGHAKIRSGTRTIGNRFWRLFQHTFRFDL